MYFDDPNQYDMDVTELLVATADHCDLGLEPCVHEVLGLVRDKMKLNAVFVRASRPESQSRALPDLPASHALEAAWGEHLLGEHLSEEESASCIHQSAPVTLADGSVYGTLSACSRGQWTAQVDVKLLRSTAQLIAQKIDMARRPLLARPSPRWADLRAAAGARPRFDADATRP